LNDDEFRKSIPQNNGAVENFIQLKKETMRATLTSMLGRLASRFGRRLPGRAKSVPAPLTGINWSGTALIDSFKRERNPSLTKLMAELKIHGLHLRHIMPRFCAPIRPSVHVARSEMQPEGVFEPIDPRTENAFAVIRTCGLFTRT